MRHDYTKMSYTPLGVIRPHPSKNMRLLAWFAYFCAHMALNAEGYNSEPKDAYFKIACRRGIVFG